MQPIYIAWVTLSLFCVVSTFPPTVWHIQQKNASAICLGFWIMLLNLNSAVNGLVWRNDAIDRAPVWCDISQKIQIGAPPGIICGCVCIVHYLAQVVGPKTVLITQNELNRRRIFEYVFCLGFPILIMALHIIWQPYRYALQEGPGCSIAFLLSWPALFLWLIWTPVLSVMGSVYGMYIIYRCYRHRQEFRDLVEGGSYALSISRFLRLSALSLSYLLVYAPLSIWATVVIFQNATFWPFEWDFVHLNLSFVLYLPPDVELPVGGWAGVVAGLCVFAFFGFATESWAIYRQVLESLGLINPVVEKPPPISAVSITAQLKRLEANGALGSTTDGTSSHSSDCLPPMVEKPPSRLDASDVKPLNL